MKPKDIDGYIKDLNERFSDLEKQLADPDIYSNPTKSRQVTQEHSKLADLFETYNSWVEALEELEISHEMLSDESDEDMREMISAEIENLETKVEKFNSQIKISLLPPDPNDEKNIIVEIKPAAGGDEAALFAGELYRLYSHYAEEKNWKMELLEMSGSDLGGIKNVAFSISGNEVFSRMKFESGVHRVQRVPETESGGRVHTSTVTVAVLPEADEVELNIKSDELRYDVFRSSGPGGQSVNTTDSAVRVTHLPSGVTVVSQQEKSQHQNRAVATRILYARLLEIKQAEEHNKLAADKRSQVGTGDRSERIRTYNFPQTRVTDHRFGLTLHSLPLIMEGELDLIIDPILAVVCERQIKDLNK